MLNLLGFFLTGVYSLLLIALSYFLKKKIGLSVEGVRKLIHIGFAHWWFIAMYAFDHPFWVILIPVIFLGLITLFIRIPYFSFLLREDKTYGVLYYPLALFFQVLLSFILFGRPYVGLLGVLIMGYGDGFASIAGRNMGKKRLHENKTLAGSLTMFLVSLAITGLVFTLYETPQMTFLALVSIASVATLLELFSKRGLDNLTVPIASSLLYIFFLLI